MINNFCHISYQFVKFVLIAFLFHASLLSRFCLADADYNRELEMGVHDFLEEQVELQPREKLNIEVKSISDKKEFPICEGETLYSVASGKIRKNNTVKIECKSKTTPFTLYVTAKIFIDVPYVTVLSAVSKNTILEADNLTIAYQDKILDKGTTFDSIDSLVGIRVKRDIKPNQPIHNNQICVVCKGDEVTIESTNGNYSVKTLGEAQQDGSYNEIIRIKNIRSGKIVRAKVINNTLVRINKINENK